MQAVLAGTAITDLSELAKIADNIIATQAVQSATCFQVTTPASQSTSSNTTTDLTDQISSLQSQMKVITAQLSALTLKNHRKP